MKKSNLLTKDEFYRIKAYREPQNTTLLFLIINYFQKFNDDTMNEGHKEQKYIVEHYIYVCRFLSIQLA